MSRILRSSYWYIVFCIMGILSVNANAQQWTAQTSGTTNGLSSVFFRDANHGWAVGNNGTIITTINGGANWSAQNSGMTNSLISVYFTDANHGWAVGNLTSTYQEIILRASL